MGVAVAASDITGERKELIKQQFNSLTPANELKPENILDYENVFLIPNMMIVLL